MTDELEMPEIPKRERRPCDLHTVEQVREWLRKPENQISSSLFVIRWDGATPIISISPTDRLAELEKDRGFAQVVLLEHRRRKERPNEEVPTNNGE